jgi:hypothetical protein
MATPQKPRQDLEFQLRTLSHHGGAAVRNVRPLHLLRPLCVELVSRGASSLASDEDYTLFTVVIFRKVYDAFVQKCRENKCEICRRIHTPAFSPRAKIHRKRLSLFCRPDREGARGDANRQYCRKGALGEFPAH